MKLSFSLAYRYLKENKRRTFLTLLAILLSIATVVAVTGTYASYQSMARLNRGEENWHVSFGGLNEDSLSLLLADSRLEKTHRTTEEAAGTRGYFYLKKLDDSIFTQVAELTKDYGLDATLTQYQPGLLALQNILPSQGSAYMVMFLVVMLFLVGLCAALSITNAFRISGEERTRQYGILRSIGATTKRIRTMVLCEAFLLALFALPLGILLGILLQWSIAALMNQIFPLLNVVGFQLSLRPTVSLPSLLVIAPLSILFIMAAAWWPAKRAATTTPLDAVKRSQTLKVEPLTLPISGFAKRVFGFGGVLAAKTRKRNGGKYRTTVTSLVICIILFIGVMGFSDLYSATTLVTSPVGANVMITLHTGTMAEQDAIAQALSQMDGVTLNAIRGITSKTKERDSIKVMTKKEVDITRLPGYAESYTTSLYQPLGYFPDSYYRTYVPLRRDDKTEAKYQAMPYELAVIHLYDYITYNAWYYLRDTQNVVSLNLFTMEDDAMGQYMDQVGYAPGLLDGAGLTAIVLNTSGNFLDTDLTQQSFPLFENYLLERPDVFGVYSNGSLEAYLHPPLEEVKEAQARGEMVELLNGQLAFGRKGWYEDPFNFMWDPFYHREPLLQRLAPIVQIRPTLFTQVLPLGFDIDPYACEINLFIAKETWLKLVPEGMQPTLTIGVDAVDPNAFEAQAHAYLSQASTGGGFLIQNRHAEVENNRRIQLMTAVLAYGFVALLSLIAITSVITTIVTNLRLRRQEFAMLKSMGMAKKTFRQMMCYESFSLSLQSLLIGIPLGFFAYRTLYEFLGLYFRVPFTWPIGAAIIAAFATFLFTFITTYFASRKERDMDVVSSVQEE
ncbi:ABC transporter permease, partial [Eubacteriales bacterium OttesenSCG-928-M02]|nr:ABC transporter permease [Eubacteriales bacterium OttesenSCG-928-M02]